jgi:DNA-binding response OmpR family regulator
MDTRNILIIEDDPLLNASLGRYFQRVGYQPLLARTAQDARNIIGHKKIDAVLMDYCLPDTVGLELLDYARRYLVFQPIFLITGTVHDGGLPREALARGANGFIAKPFSAYSLKEMLEPYMETHRGPQAKKETTGIAVPV